ncbi:Nramp family divalent metal transporter [Riemerella anatipestifer]|uniref:Divalent metal cation transporter MntH n=2 Tax=Riemerella anatipestifer TaxID=34085 RepID=H8M9Q2_RIEAD|nr:Nramp family divalent metal transporter [Riemerella anatipestifer]AFD55844.1 mn2+/fe2+ transporter, nramp family [Riemerella anatipestifer ATCC 11845 = DSM 15868]EFT36166.1 Manganese transport protein MntH [Riemerella anatipestifer RA-YM]MDR7633979.1 Nramp family divalent metal transporter [Riemerella anatipestifer]MDR7877946.1 Nramp family divalent metal transporter [Riemerella anatipestifer]MDY3493512.1 Nramp family divalent metal transporter [Riemerella anatipestifer]
MWKKERSGNSLSESFSSIEVPKDVGFWKKFLAFVGPGLMVAVGYMDPGNWATGIAGGAKFGYTLLSVILISNLFAMLLQHLSLKLGIVAERDLAQACRDSYSRPVNFLLWIFAEIAIAATDLAEVIGAAIALNLLFGIPLTIGIAITVVDVFVILMLQAKGFRWLESVVGGLIAIIFFCFLYEIVVSNPEWFPILKGLVPQKEIVFNPSMLYIAIGILGATVMPHNLYLHSSIVQTRNYSRDDKGKREAIKFATLDSNISLLLAFLINAAILIISSAAFHHTGYQDVADITDAHQLLSPILGTSLASIVFAIALLASGQNSTLTGTLAGQIVMEGFLNIKLKPWLRRLITRLIAVIPALIVATIYGEKGTTDLLILSQVILSLQLSFAVVPLVMLTNNKLKMGAFANQGFLKYTAIIISFIIIVLNIYLVYTEMG